MKDGGWLQLSGSSGCMPGTRKKKNSPHKYTGNHGGKMESLETEKKALLWPHEEHRRDSVQSSITGGMFLARNKTQVQAG